MMQKTKTLSFLFFFTLTATSQLHALPIKYIFIDINALITPSTSAASKIVGIINSMKYTATVGHIPSRSDLFKALHNIPAKTVEFTYNEDLKMPGILCDWLLGLQTNHQIKSEINAYLEHSSMAEIEKTIFKNISFMMMTPSIFIDTQHVVKDFIKIVHTLKKMGYTVIVVGNWDKESEPLLIKLLNSNALPDAQHYYFSHKAKCLKPNPQYFEQLLKQYHIVSKQECLIIDVEKQHAQAARSLGFPVILLHGHNTSQLKSELNRIGIRL